MDGEDGHIVNGTVGGTAVDIRQLRAALIDDDGRHWGKVGLRVSWGFRRLGRKDRWQLSLQKRENIWSTVDDIFPGASS